MQRIMIGIVMCLIMILGTAGIAGQKSEKRLSPGNRWIRSHDFQVMAVVEGPQQIAHYKELGFTSLMVTNINREGYLEKMADYAVKNKLPWYWLYRWSPSDANFVEKLNACKRYPGLRGILIGDETNDKYFSKLAVLFNEARKVDPELLLSHCLLGLDVSEYANDLDVYRAYLQKAVDVLNVDVLMFDQYPFRRHGTAKTFFKNLAVFRQCALKSGKPYWNWLQAFGWTKGPFDEPGESQIALQAYASLAYGYTGLGYWTYSSNYSPYSRSLVDAKGHLTPTGKVVREFLPDIKAMGNVLTSLNSTGIYYAAISGGNVPDGLERLTSISHPLLRSASVSNGKLGFLLGMFRDDHGNDYMMLVNTNHGYKKTSAETASAISVQFRGNVESLERLNTQSGRFVSVSLNMKKLNNYVVPGGNGQLFRIVLK